MIKHLYSGLGFLSLSLAAVGAVLPLMPSTCFILLAAWSFAKSSPRFYQALLGNKYCGKTIRQWEESRTIPIHASRFAIASMFISGVVSLAMLDSLGLQFLLIGLLGLGIAFVYLHTDSQLVKS